MSKKDLLNKIEQNLDTAIRDRISDIENIRVLPSSISWKTGKLKLEIVVGEMTRAAWQEELGHQGDK